MAGEPRLDGRRITVFQVASAVSDFGGVSEAAEQLRISESEVKIAMEWARNHPHELVDLRAVRKKLAAEVEGDATT